MGGLSGAPTTTNNRTSTPFAALEVATGKVNDAGKPRHLRQEFLAFLKQVARANRQASSNTAHSVDQSYLRSGRRRATFRPWVQSRVRVRSSGPNRFGGACLRPSTMSAAGTCLTT